MAADALAPCVSRSRPKTINSFYISVRKPLPIRKLKPHVLKLTENYARQVTLRWEPARTSYLTDLTH